MTEMMLNSVLVASGGMFLANSLSILNLTAFLIDLNSAYIKLYSFPFPCDGEKDDLNCWLGCLFNLQKESYPSVNFSVHQ